MIPSDRLVSATLPQLGQSPAQAAASTGEDEVLAWLQAARGDAVFTAQDSSGPEGGI